MASRRLLMNLHNNSQFMKMAGLLLLMLAILIGCGTTEKAQKDTGGGTTRDTDTAEEATISEEFMAVLNSNRSKLSDAYSSLNYKVPNVFMQESTARDIGDPNEGYRIQILSTRNVARADSVADNFRLWANDNFTDYIPNAYVFFRQPYYKVHVGNFQFQDHAMKLNKLLKERYPDAWVVYDKIEPNLVPADTSNIRRQ